MAGCETLHTVPYPFYLGENLMSCAASRDFVGFATLVRRNIDVIMNHPHEPPSAKKLRVSALISLVVRAIYRTGADPEKLQELGFEAYQKLSKIPARKRDEIKGLLIAFATSAFKLVPEVLHSHPSLLQRFFDQIDQDKDGKLTVEVVAGNLNISASHLCRAVKMAAGRTPSEYIRLAKLSRARELLATHSVTDAALDSGFSKVSTFISLFRKTYGETPGVFKRRMSLSS
jgi:AraC-like DNA-binding protein